MCYTAFDCVDHNKLWKVLKEMGIPEHLTCLLRNLYAGQEATVRTGHGTMDWLQTRKGVRQDSILSLCLFNLYAEYIRLNAWLDEAQTGEISGEMPGEISIISDMQMIPGGGHSNPLQYSCLENPMDRGDWRATGSQRVGHN